MPHTESPSRNQTIPQESKRKGRPILLKFFFFLVKGLLASIVLLLIAALSFNALYSHSDYSLFRDLKHNLPFLLGNSNSDTQIKAFWAAYRLGYNVGAFQKALKCFIAYTGTKLVWAWLSVVSAWLSMWVPFLAFFV